MNVKAAQSAPIPTGFIGGFFSAPSENTHIAPDLTQGEDQKGNAPKATRLGAEDVRCARSTPHDDCCMDGYANTYSALPQDNHTQPDEHSLQRRFVGGAESFSIERAESPSPSGGYVFEREDSGARREKDDDMCCGGYIGAGHTARRGSDGALNVWERYGMSSPVQLSRPAFAHWSIGGEAAAAVPAPAAPAARSARLSPVKLLLAAAMTIASITSPWWIVSDSCAPFAKRVALLSSAMQSPAFIVSGADGTIMEGDTIFPQEQQTVTPTDTTTETQPTTAPSQTEQPTGDMKPIRTVQIANRGINEGSVWVKNSTPYEISIKDNLAAQPNCKIKLNAGYQVLIIHTHTTECYAQSDDGLYDPAYSPRTTDKAKNIVAVGDVITDCLEEKGIRTLHVTTVHDYPKYNGSYDRAAETISEYLEKYPSIEMVIDVHRDAMTQDDGTKLKPTAEITGKKAAQVMIISGCDAGGSLYFPGWRDNLCMAVHLQKRTADAYPALMRPLYFAPYRYNMHLTPNSLLVEFGTDANTLDEAKYSAKLFGQQLASQLLEYVVQ